MSEAHVSFNAGGLKLEGLFRHGSTPRGAVVCHPHPLHGGDMHNPVVTTVVAAYAGAGHSVLRFNFRGTGASQGSHGGGLPERDDLLGAVRFLGEQGIDEICLAGYSFGAFVIAQLPADGLPPTRVLIAPPVRVMEFSATAIKGLSLVVTGSQDQLAPPDAVAKLLPSWSKEACLEVVEGADHFFTGRLDRLGEVLAGLRW